MSDSDEAQNTHWTFFNTVTFFNIDSETLGILRAPSSGEPGGPYVILCTERPSPECTSDKIWIINYNELDGTFRFESGSGRFLYHNVYGNVTHSLASETDSRSKWEAILKSESLSISNIKNQSASIKIYTNPAEDEFTITFNNIYNIDRVEIYNILGRPVYQKAPKSSVLLVENTGFKT